MEQKNKQSDQYARDLARLVKKTNEARTVAHFAWRDPRQLPTLAALERMRVFVRLHGELAEKVDEGLQAEARDEQELRPEALRKARDLQQEHAAVLKQFASMETWCREHIPKPPE